MKKQILILGTSNAIFRDGYPHWLNEYETLCVHQFSLGASPSLIGVYRILQDIDLNEYEYAILDFSINDHDAIFTGNDFYATCTAFLGILSLFKNSSCTPLILLLSQMKYDFLEYNMHGMIGNFFDIKIIPAHHILRDKRQSIRRDPHHYNESAQKIIAHLIYDALTSPISQPNYQYFNDNPIQMSLGTQNGMHQEHVGHGIQKTSIVTTAIQKINPKSRLSYTTENYLCGMVYWAKKNMNNIKIISDQSELLLKLEIHWEALIARQITSSGQTIQSCTLKYAQKNPQELNSQDIHIVDTIFCNENPYTYGEKFVNSCQELQTLLRVRTILWGIKEHDNIRNALLNLKTFLESHDDPYLLTLYAEILVGIKEFDYAQHVLEKSIKKSPYYAQSYIILSLLYASLGKDVEALSAKRLAAKYNTDFFT